MNESLHTIGDESDAPGWRRALPLVSLAAFAVTLVLALRAPVLDDAYISFRYALNLVRGHGLAFNPGQVVEGFSNFLWTMLAAGWIATGFDPVAISRIAGLACSFGSVLLVLVMLRKNNALAAALGVAVLCVTPAFVRHAANGMETALFGFLITLGFFAANRNRNAAALVFALAALTRFEGGLFFAVWWIVTGIGRYRDEGRLPKNHLISAAVFAAVFVPYFVWRWSYFGALLPNTFYAKTAPLIESLPLGLHYAAGFFAACPVFVLALIRFRRPLDPMYAAFAAFAVYVVLVGGDSFDNYRFFAPVAPIGVVLAFTHASWAARPLQYVAFALMAVAALIGLIRMDVPRMDLKPYADAVGRVASPGQSVATAVIGEIGYRNPDVAIVDVLGLTDPVIAHGKADADVKIHGHRKFDADRVLGQEPDYYFPIGRIAVEDGTLSFSGFEFDTAIVESPRLQAEYDLRAVKTDGRTIAFFARRGASR